MPTGKAQAGQVDMGPAVKSYQTGIDLIGNNFQKAITPYIQGMSQAQIAQIDQLTKENQLSAPYQQTNYDAMNQFRQFLGMSPLTRDSNITASIQGMAQKLQAAGPFANGGASAYVNGLADKAKLLETTDDPTQRAALKQQIAQGLQQFQHTINTQLTDRQIEDAVAQSGKSINGAGINSMGQYAQAAGLDVKNMFGGKYNSWADYDAAKRANGGMLDIGSSDYFGGKDGIINPEEYNIAKNAMQGAAGSINGILSSMDTYAPTTKPTGMTGQEITDQVRNLPGYQFNYDQGKQALDRSQAARGIGNSGNAMIEAQQYGQNYADKAYQTHLGNLASLAGIAAPISQTSTTQLPQIGAQLAQPYASMGTFAGNNIQQGLALQQQGYNTMGNMQGQGAIAQAQMDTQASLANAQMGMGMLNQGLGFLGKLF